MRDCLLLCGLGCAVAFRARLWNVGAEGQLLLGAWAATGVASHWLPASTPAPLMLTALAVALPALLAADSNVHGDLSTGLRRVVKDAVLHIP